MNFKIEEIALIMSGTALFASIVIPFLGFRISGKRFEREIKNSELKFKKEKCEQSIYLLFRLKNGVMRVMQRVVEECE